MPQTRLVSAGLYTSLLISYLYWHTTDIFMAWTTQQSWEECLIYCHFFQSLYDSPYNHTGIQKKNKLYFKSLQHSTIHKSQDFNSATIFSEWLKLLPQALLLCLYLQSILPSCYFDSLPLPSPSVVAVAATKEHLMWWCKECVFFSATDRPLGHWEVLSQVTLKNDRTFRSRWLVDLTVMDCWRRG